MFVESIDLHRRLSVGIVGVFETKILNSWNAE